ncbi:MAG: cytochrome C oxidase subunit I [Massilia sp.]
MNRNSARWKLLLVLFVCASPLIFSYLAYYVIKPTGRTNYGALIDPRAYPIPPMASTALDGKPQGLDAWKGKWIMLKVGASDCAQACREQLFAMRQLRLMQGKDMERIERVWLVTDAEPLSTLVMRESDGTRLLRAPADAVAKWLPVDAGDRQDSHIYLIDPLGNLMMRFPALPPNPSDEARREHHNKIKKDLAKLLKASAIG